MRNIYTEQSSNITKTWMLMLGMFALIVAVGWFFSWQYANPTILYIAVFFSVGLNIFSYWFSDKIALKMSGAVPADPVRHAEIYRSLGHLSISAGLPQPRLYIIDDSAPNAFATGRNKKHSAVAVTTGLVARLDKAELEGVIAHELAHIGNKDILISTIAVISAGFLSILADMFLRGALFGGFGGSNSEGEGSSRGMNPLVIVGIVLVVLSPIAGTMIQLAISRKREFLADATGAMITRYPEGLARALEKISGHEQEMHKAHNATAHLYISNPFGAKAIRGIHGLFMTHPPIAERVSRLRQL